MRLILALVAVAIGGCAGLRELEIRAIVGPLAGGAAREPGRPVAAFTDEGIALHGYYLRPPRKCARGLVLLLHGQGARASFWNGEARALAEAGFAVSAWDGRGHGCSGGRCSFGARERFDVRRELDALAHAGLDVTRTILYGYSMGAVVALLAAVDEPRVRGVVAVAPFATLEAVIRRVVWAAPRSIADRAIELAESAAHFHVDAVRPAAAAMRLTIPLLLVAGGADDRAPPTDAWSIASAARGRATLLVVPGASHADVLRRCGPACDLALGELFHAAGL